MLISQVYTSGYHAVQKSYFTVGHSEILLYGLLYDLRFSGSDLGLDIA